MLKILETLWVRLEKYEIVSTFFMEVKTWVGKTMTQNRLSIHVESGDMFYDNHNT